MLVALGVLFLLLNIPLFRLAILDEAQDEPAGPGRRRFIPWLVILTVFPAATFWCGEYAGEPDVLFDVSLQAYVAVSWIPVVGVILYRIRAADNVDFNNPPPLSRVFAVLLLLLFGGLIGNAVWLLLRIVSQGL